MQRVYCNIKEGGNDLVVDTKDLYCGGIWTKLSFDQRQGEAADRVIDLYHRGCVTEPSHDFNWSCPRSTLERTAQDPYVVDRIIWAGVLMLHPKWKHLLLQAGALPASEEKLQRTGNGTNHHKDPCARYQLDLFTIENLVNGTGRKKEDYMIKIPRSATQRMIPVP